jgi:hypothetical protein
VASEKGYVDIVTLLLEKGAGIDSATPDAIEQQYQQSHPKKPDEGASNYQVLRYQ